jgi:tetratricopeptide (TPR) repeat protein
MATTVGLVALGTCGAVSAQQLQYWRNPDTLHLHSVTVMPKNPAAHAHYALFLRDDLRYAEAEAECEKAIQLSTNYAWGHQLLGGILYFEGKMDRADAELKTAFRLNPARTDIHYDLGRVAFARNLPDEAEKQYRLMLASFPSMPEAHCGLGEALAAQGKLDAAAAEYDEALRLAPQDPDAHFQKGVLEGMKHNATGAIAEYRAALAVQPERVDALNNLAWILATDSHLEIRDGSEAVQLSGEACQLTHSQQAVTMGTFAAACAEAGNFDDAIAAAQKAHDLAVAQGNQALAARNLELLNLYRSHHAFHEQ